MQMLAKDRGMMAVRMAGMRFDAGDWAEYLTANIYFALQDEDLRYELLGLLKKLRAIPIKQGRFGGLFCHGVLRANCALLTSLVHTSLFRSANILRQCPCQGMRVIVPLAGTACVSVLSCLLKNTAVKCGSRISSGRSKRLPLLTDDLFDLANDMAVRQGASLALSWAMSCQMALRQPVCRLRGQEQMIDIRKLKNCPPEEYETWAKNFANGLVDILPPGIDAAASEYCVLQVDPPWPVRPAAKRQLAVLDFWPITAQPVAAG